ncbi:MAG: hypothetical protein H6981_10815 [Gammaproteobacteria bacterium]|nr:hypothetical protein [Gammaproteobacteria bacterium]MCP5137280.1 hypothetical protein [Gammaproteobacteria bacterium]
MRSLAAALNWPANRVARLMYLAPQVLEGNIERDRAERLLELVNEAGLQASIQEQGAVIEEGVPDYDIALVIRDFSHIGAIVQLISHVLGVKPDKAREIICASPALLMGGVSLATVEALRARFQALKVDLDVAVRSQSRYDLILAPGSAVLRQRVMAIVARHLGKAGQPMPNDNGAPLGGMIATGLDFKQANALWDELRGGGASAQLVNRTFERFDVVMREATDSRALREYLSDRVGVPAQVVEKLIQRLPIVVQRQMTPEQAEAALLEFADLGVLAVAELTTFQAFDLNIDALSGKKDKAVQVLSSLADRSQESAVTALSKLPTRLDGPFTSTHARWLQAELKNAGASSRLVQRA